MIALRHGEVTSDGDVMADFAKAEEDMSTEEVEALLEAMKAMRAERDDDGHD